MTNLIDVVVLITPDGDWGAVKLEEGAAWGDEDSDANDPGYMGGFPIGPDCHRKYRVRGA